jgi:hypothetical protein
MSGILEGLFSKALWDGIKAGGKRVFGREIKITSPRPLETLLKADMPDVYWVRGTLKHLQENEEIWLITQDQTSGRFWPQGFFPVQFDRHQKIWTGKVHVALKSHVRIIAVVAPPTSQDFFRYYQKVGSLRGGEFEPLVQVPLECRNQDSVQAFPPEK